MSSLTLPYVHKMYIIRGYVHKGDRGRRQGTVLCLLFFCTTYILLVTAKLKDKLLCINFTKNLHKL